MMKINFRLDKRSKSELKPIVMQITHQGGQIKRSTGVGIFECEWFDKIDGNSSFIRGKLSDINLRVESQFKMFKDAFNRDPSIEELKDILDSKEEAIEEESTQITVLIRKYIKVRGKIYSESRKHGYKRAVELINEFLEESDFKDDYNTINKTWVLSFIDFLCCTKGYTNSTVESILKRLRAVLGFYDIKIQFKMAEVMQGMRGKKINNEIPFLTLEDLKQVSFRGLTILTSDDFWKKGVHKIQEDEQKVIDLFLLCSYTGMRYSESQMIEIADIDFSSKETSELSDNTKLIVTLKYTSSKNGSTIEVPLNKAAENIINKYEGCLPKMSNAKVNKIIHKIFKNADFTKEYKTVHYNGKNRVEKLAPLYDLLTFHDSRKAFGCNLIEGGLDMQSVADLMGINVATLQKWYSKSNKQDRNLKALNILNK